MPDKACRFTASPQACTRAIYRLVLLCLITSPAVASSMGRIIGGTPVIDYQMTGTMTIESGGAPEEVAASFETHPQQLSPYPTLVFNSSLGLFRFRLTSLSLDTALSLAEGRKFVPAWKDASVDRPGSRSSLPLRCQIVSVDGKFSSRNKKNPKEFLEEGVPFPYRPNPDADKASMWCANHNLGLLFESGLPFGAELTRAPLSVRLPNAGSTICLNIPGELEGNEARLRVCATGLAAQARLSYF